MTAMHGKQLATFVVAVIMVAVSSLVVATRCFIRFCIKGFGIDDGLMVGGQLLFIGCCASVIHGCIAGVGIRDAHLTPEQQMTARHDIINFELLYVSSLILVKTSICWALLRITTSKIFKAILYGIVFVSFCSGLVTTVMILTVCTPVSAVWSGRGKCGSPQNIVAVAYFLSITSVVTDFACSIMPWFILWKLQMKKSIKYTLAAILALGFISAIATLARIPSLHRFTHLVNYIVDYVWGSADVMLFSVIEVGVGTTMASLPAMRPLLRLVNNASLTSTDAVGNTTLRRSTVNDTLRSTHKHSIYQVDNTGSSGDIEDKYTHTYTNSPTERNSTSLGVTSTATATVMAPAGTGPAAAVPEDVFSLNADASEELKKKQQLGIDRDGIWVTTTRIRVEEEVDDGQNSWREQEKEMRDSA